MRDGSYIGFFHVPAVYGAARLTLNDKRQGLDDERQGLDDERQGLDDERQ